MANLKWSKFRIVHHFLLSFFFFSSQPSAVIRKVTQLKQPSIVRISPKDHRKVCSFVLSLKQNYCLCWASSNNLQIAICYHAGHHFHWACCCPCNDDNHECMGGTNNLYVAIKKEQKQVFIKRFLKKNLADVGMAQWMHWLTKYKKCCCTQWYTLYNTTLFNNHLYINSSATSAGTKFTALPHSVTGKVSNLASLDDTKVSNLASLHDTESFKPSFTLWYKS